MEADSYIRYCTGKFAGLDTGLKVCINGIIASVVSTFMFCLFLSGGTDSGLMLYVAEILGDRGVVVMVHVAGVVALLCCICASLLVNETLRYGSSGKGYSVFAENLGFILESLASFAYYIYYIMTI